MSAIQKKDYSLLYETIEHILVHPLFVSLICNVLVNVLYFALMMASFVLGITLVFNLMEETGYLARFPSSLTIRCLRLVGREKQLMPFFMGLGCTIAIALFGSNGGFFVILSIFLFMFLMMWAVYKIFWQLPLSKGGSRGIDHGTVAVP